MSSGFGFWSKSIARIADEARGIRDPRTLPAASAAWASGGGVLARVAARTRSTIAARCSGLVPQQPPTMRMPNCSTNSPSMSAIGAGSSG
jgi:hypothetical protein